MNGLPFKRVLKEGFATAIERFGVADGLPFTYLRIPLAKSELAVCSWVNDPGEPTLNRLGEPSQRCLGGRWSGSADFAKGIPSFVKGPHFLAFAALACAILSKQ